MTAAPSLPGDGPAGVAATAMVLVEDPAAPVVGPDDVAHLLSSLRIRGGETVLAGDGRGTWARCRVAGTPGSTPGADGAGLLVPDGPVVVEAAPDVALTVAFAPVKGDRPEWVVQKLTELGVDRIVPLRTARSVVRWEGDRAARALARLRRVAREATAQARRAWLPEVTDVVTLDGLAVLAPAGGPALAERGGPPPSLDLPVVAVGPEGGWEPSELDAVPATVGLGPTVLRAETAAVTIGAVLCALRAGTVEPAGR